MLVLTILASTALSYAGDSSLYRYYFQHAISRLTANDIDGALDLLLYCQQLNPEAAETYFFLGECYGQQENDSLRVQMISKAAELCPDNDTYKEALIPIYLDNNDIAKATATIEGLVANTPERTDMLNVLLQIYNYTHDYNMVLNTLNRLEVQEGQSEQLAMSKVQTYVRLGNDKKAYKELKSLCANHPLDLNYRVMMGNWLLSKGRKKEAVSEYRTVLDEEPDNEGALMSMMDYYRAEGQDSLANQQRDNILLSPKTQQSTRLLLLKQYVREQEQQSTDSTNVLRLFNRVLTQGQPDIQVLELKLAYEMMKDMPKDSITLCLNQMIDLQPDHAQARLQLIQMAWEEKRYNDMISLAKPALEFNPDKWEFSYFLGVGYFLNGDNEQCIEAMKTAAENINEKENKELASELYYVMGDAYHSCGKSEEAYEAYENCLRIDSEKISCLNNYAYYLSEENRDLDKAAAMSLKTVKAEPSNSTYLDTYAWIMFLQGRYEEAKIYIDMAIKYLDKTAENDVYYNHQKEIESKLNK